VSRGCVESTQDADGKNSMHTEKHIHLYRYSQTYYKQSYESSIDLFFFAFLGNRSCTGPCTGCEKIRREITKHRIICKNKKLKITANQWSRSHRIFQTAFESVDLDLLA